jgi:hypothetical protein
MNKAEEKSREYVLPFLDKQYEKYGEHKQMELSRFDGYDMMSAYEGGYKQAEKDIKEELSNLFQEFMLDCINDDTETHILHFVDVFNNKIKTIGNE